MSTALDFLDELNAELEEAATTQQQQEQATAFNAVLALSLLGEADGEFTYAEQIDINSIENVLDMVLGAMNSLEDHLQTFEASIGDGGITKQAYNALAVTISNQCGIVGHVFTTLAGESIDKPGGRAEATHYSAESLKDSLKAGWKRTVAVFNSLIEAVAKFYKKHASAVGRFKKKADTLADIAKDLKGSPGKDAKVKISKDFFIGTKPAKLKDLEDTIKLLQRFSKDKGVEVALKGLGKAYGEGKVSTDAEAQATAQSIDGAVNALADAIEKSLDITKDTSDIKERSLPKENEYETVRATENMIGNFKVVLGKPGAKTDRMPSVVVLPTTHKVKEETMPALGKSDIEAYAKACSDLAAVIIEISEGFDKKAAEEVISGADKLVKASDGAEISKGELDALKQRIKQVRVIAKVCREPGSSLATRMASVGTAAYNIAFKSAKAHKED